MEACDDIRIVSRAGTETLAFEWGELTWFANRALGNSEAMTVGRCVLRPHAANPRHYHPNCSEILVVMKGRIRHSAANGEEAVMEEGDVVTIPPNVWHRATNLGHEDAVLMIAFSSADRRTVGE
jgi:quercetin dioxygenase-like cupin family protein